MKFDGQNCTVYNHSDSGLPTDDVTSISIDAKDNLWVGMHGKVAMFDGKNWTVFNKNNSCLPNDYINFIAIDPNDTKWICTNGGGLARFDDNG